MTGGAPAKMEVCAMLNRTLVVALLATATLASPAFAQSYGSGPATSAGPNADKERIVIAERVISENPTVIERKVIAGKIMRMPDRNPGISKIGGTVGGAIGGYYINGVTPAHNLPLDIPSDAYTR
jgi:hypothetical protein